MRIIYHQRANGIQQDPNIDKVNKGIDEIPYPDSESSLHLRIYMTHSNVIDYWGIDHIIRSILDKSIHQKIWIIIIPAFFGEEYEYATSHLDLSILINRIRSIDRVDRVGIAFDNVERLLNNDIDVDFYGMRFSVVRHDKKILRQFKNLPKTVYSTPDAVVKISRYIETLNVCCHRIAMVEYSSFEENRLIINDHGFIYQIQDNQK